MPCSPAKARCLLKEKKAVVIRRTPFTIQLTIATGETKQPVSLGVDAGYKHVGLSASSEKAELYASEVELRQDITELLSARLALRRFRRNRKTRYRAPRFDNRVYSTVNKKDGLLHQWRTVSTRTFCALKQFFEFFQFPKSLWRQRRLTRNF